MLSGESYLAIKQLHIVLALLSVSGFVLRAGLLWWSGSRPKPFNFTEGFVFRRLPHINDSLLLALGLLMAISAQINPFVQVWLGYKLIALVLYIVLAAQVIKQRGSLLRQGLCFSAALACFALMLKLALTKQLM